MTVLRRTVSVLAATLLLLFVFAGGWLTGRLGIGRVIDPVSLSDSERQFTERMRNVSMVGTFTVDGRDRTPREDRYDISKVEKIGDDLWRFTVKMKCCGIIDAVPIAVPMRFNGDTPTIMMTDLSLPGMGTFTVRLLFYGDRYAGSWQHGKFGGHMTGRIEKQTATDE